jgi:acyl-CoA thioesterase FadM
MNLYLRLAYAICVGLLAERLDHRYHLRSSFRVWPHDLDAFGHMNNGRYLQIMDVARAEWMARIGVLSIMWRQRWGATLGGGFVRFRRSLKPFQRYRVRTRLLSWDERWWYLEHCFFDMQGRQIATGVSRAALRGNSDWVHTADVIALVHPGAHPPPLPDYVERWLRAEDDMWNHSVQATAAVVEEQALTETTQLEVR